MLLVSWCVLVLSAVHPMSPWNHQALVSLREELQLSVLMESGFGNRLEKAAGGFMTRFEAQTVREQPGNIKQMDKVIDILLGKADKDFTTFLKMLQDSNNEVWAEELEKKAEQFKKEGTLCVERRDQSEVHAVLNVKLMQFSLLGPIPICVHICVCVCVRTCVRVSVLARMCDGILPLHYTYVYGSSVAMVTRIPCMYIHYKPILIDCCV